MKCQRCGAEIAEGNLYCSSCGMEIRIVPDFEPEVEHAVNQAMNHILDDVFQSERKETTEFSDRQTRQLQQKEALQKPKRVSEKKPAHGGKQGKASGNEKHSKGKKAHYRWFILLISISLAVVLLALGYMNFTSDYQLRRGNYFFSQANYERAIRHYERAQDLDPADARIMLHLAECYEKLDQKAGYEACLTKVVQNEHAQDTQRDIAFERLARLYLENKEYQKIDSLLKNCNNENILKTYEKYRAILPRFSHEGGSYQKMIALKLQCDGQGRIYYTTDGSDPSTESSEYTGTIFLDKGEYTIKAICVNEFGVVSEVVTMKYSIKF